MTEKIKIMLVDDHRMVRLGFSTLISEFENMQLVGEAENGEAAIKLFEAIKPDVVLMDIFMPHMNGIDAARKILEAHPEARILMMTAFSDTDLLTTALKAGVIGAIEKNITTEDFVMALQMALRGKSWISQPILRGLIDKLSNTEPQRHTHQLTQRELEISRLLVTGKTNQEIAGQLKMSINTLKKSLTILFAKLNVSNRAEAASILAKSNILE